MSKKKKVAIVGYSPTRANAPYNDTEWEIWGINDLWKFNDVPRYDRWFDLHTFDTAKEPDKIKGIREAFSVGNTPIYLQEVDPDLPNSRRYPIEAIRKEFGSYFTNTISFMIALAIYEGYEEIGVYGVDMSTYGEYSHQRASCEYFLGIAVGKGIKVTVPDGADLLKSRFIYGYETEKDRAWKAKISGLKKHSMVERNKADAQIEQLKEVRWQYNGAVEAYKHIDNLWDTEGSEPESEKV